MEVGGSGFQLYSIYAANNGRTKFESPAGVEGWADGITLLRCDNSTVHDSWAVDNTDIGIVVGSGTGCTIEHNTISNLNRVAFAGFHEGTFLGATSQPNAQYRYNTISSGYNLEAFGLVVGYHPWSNGSLFDLDEIGTVRNNNIQGAVVNLAIDGIQSGLITGNTMSGHQGNDGWGCSLTYNYTAGDYGSASLQSGWVPLVYHFGACF
jgi:parallel beta-helix repeat protein